MSDWIDAWHKADELFAMGCYKEALSAYRLSLELNPGEAGTIGHGQSVSWRLGLTLVRLGRLKEAQDCIQKIDTAPIHPVEWLALAECQSVRHELAKAIQSSSIALEKARSARRSLSYDLQNQAPSSPSAQQIKKELDEVTNVLISADSLLERLKSTIDKMS